MVLWLAKKMNVRISKAVGDKIVKLDDDVVALVALDLNHLGYWKRGDSQNGAAT